MSKSLIIATRGSRLALQQAKLVANRLLSAHPHLRITINVIESRGDLDQQSSLIGIQQTGFFTDTLEEALLKGEADLVVHSMKDMSFPGHPALQIGAVLERGDAREVAVHRSHQPISNWHRNQVIGTCSARRTWQLAALCAARVVPIRGSVDERLQKMEGGAVDGLILAAAGLQRIQLDAYITEYLSTETLMPSPCQAIIAIQCKQDNKPLLSLLQSIHDEPTGVLAQIESTLVQGFGELTEAAPAGIAQWVNRSTLQLKARWKDQSGNTHDQTLIGDSRFPLDLAARMIDCIDTTTYQAFIA